jgi:hypothetical protein
MGDRAIVFQGEEKDYSTTPYSPTKHTRFDQDGSKYVLYLE